MFVYYNFLSQSVNSNYKFHSLIELNNQLKR